jgi:hypothetical protein
LHTGKTMGALKLQVKEYVTADGVRHEPAARPAGE